MRAYAGGCFAALSLHLVIAAHMTSDAASQAILLLTSVTVAGSAALLMFAQGKHK